MENRIYKQTLEVTDEQTITLPFGAKILSVQTQNNQPQIWYEFDTRIKGEERVTLLTIGTGSPFSNFRTEYIGTYQLHDGSLVFHLYKRI